jgi:protein gp37
MALSKIEWCDYTANQWDGCENVAKECDNCYAEARNKRFGGGIAPNFGKGKPRNRLKIGTRRAPLSWNRKPFYQCDQCSWRGPEKKLAKIGSYGTLACPACKHVFLTKVRPRVFAQSLSDTFDNKVPAEWRDDFFVLMEQCTNLDWLVLTKRIGNVRKMVPARWLEPGGWPQHIRLGVTAGTQEAADRDIPRLLELDCPNFVSMEPLLEPVHLNPVWLDRQRGCDGKHHGIGTPECPSELHHHHDDRCGRGIEWVITGGESGRGENIRPSHPDWYRALRDQCLHAGVAYLHKQNGEWTGGENVNRIGKERAGRLLDGVTHDQFPEQRAAA